MATARRGPGQGARRAAASSRGEPAPLPEPQRGRGPPADVPAQLDLVEHAYRALAAGRVELPPKPGVHPRKDSFLHAMPAYLRDEDVVTLKWVGGYPANKAKGLPYISGLIVVNDAETGLPGRGHGRGRDHRGAHRCGQRRLRPALRARRAGGGRRSSAAASRGSSTRGSCTRSSRACEIRAWDPHPERIARARRPGRGRRPAGRTRSPAPRSS